MKTPPSILAAACLFPSGPSLALADAAVRTQLSLLQYHPDYRDSAGGVTRVSCFTDTPSFDAVHWGLLARHALAQLTQALRPHWSALQTSPRLLWLVLPDTARPGMPAGLAERVVAAVRDELWPWQQIRLVHGGHAAGVAALVAARQTLHAMPNALAVVLAVEAGLSHETLYWLEQQGLVNSADVPHHGRLRRNPYGRVPGEGAAAIALGASALHAPATWARLLGCATADEPITHTSPQPCTGLGLTSAARQAIEQAQASHPALIGQLIADLNGEPYRADQFGFAALRLGHALGPDWQRCIPALASGDLHSASALAHIALAAYRQRHRPQARHTLVLASSDDSLRGAVVLGASQPVHQPLPEVRPWQSPSMSTA